MKIKRYNVDDDGIAQEDEQGAFCLAMDVSALEGLLECYKSDSKPEIKITCANAKYAAIFSEALEFNLRERPDLISRISDSVFRGICKMYGFDYGDNL